jgi:hypothetical protein
VFFIIILYSILGHAFLIKLSKTTHEVKERHKNAMKSENDKKLSEEMIAMNTVMIKGLNTRFSVKFISDQLK